jgi:hypothetical protein
MEADNDEAERLRQEGPVDPGAQSQRDGMRRRTTEERRAKLD